jgi:hypothetical protein
VTLSNRSLAFISSSGMLKWLRLSSLADQYARTVYSELLWPS